MLRRTLDTEAVGLCAAGKSGVILTGDYRRVPSIAAYRWDAKYQFGLIVKIDQAEALAPVRAFGGTVVLISILALVCAAGLAFVLAGTITRPLRTLQERVRRFAEGNNEGPPPEISGDEITLVAGEFEGMAGRVAERTAELAKANLALQVENAVRTRIGEQLRVQATALDAAANAIVITDHHGAILSVNPAFTALTGYTAPEAAGQNPRFLKSGKQDAAFYRNLWQTISAGQVWGHGELTNRRKDGSLYHEEMTITPLRNPDGTIARYIAIKSDISERKRAEEELKFKSVILSTQQEVSIDGILVVDENGAVLSVQPPVCPDVGHPGGVVSEKKVDKLLLDFVLRPGGCQSFLQRVQYLFYEHRREINREEILLRTAASSTATRPPCSQATLITTAASGLSATLPRATKRRKS